MIGEADSKEAKKGRKGDTYTAHLMEGEMVIPPIISDELRQRLYEEMEAAGINPEEYTVGEGMSINPETGMPEFGVFKSAKKLVTKAFKKTIGNAVLKPAVKLIDKIPGGEYLVDAALFATGNPELIPLAHGFETYGRTGDLGQSLISGGIAYGGQQLGGLLKGTPVDGFGNKIVTGDAGTLLAGTVGTSDGLVANSAGALGGGIGGASSAYASSGFGGAYDDVINGISDFSNSVSDFVKPVTEPVSDLYNSASKSLSGVKNSLFPTDPVEARLNPSAVTSTIGTDVAKKLDTSQFLNAGLNAGLGLYTNNNAEKDLIASQKKNASLLNPFLTSSFEPGDLTADPGYQFQLAQGNAALDRRNAAGGNFFSGAALKEAQDYGQGLAGTTYNDAYSRFLSDKNQKLQVAGALTGVNDNIGNIKANSGINTGNLLSSSIGSLLGGQTFSNTGSRLGNESIEDIIARLQGRSSYARA